MKVNVITTAGQEYFSRCIVGNTAVRFSNIKVGSGEVSSIEEAKALTMLKDTKKNLGISSAENVGAETILKTMLNNIGTENNYDMKEVGIYVDNGGEELLFWYINYGTDCSNIQAQSTGVIRVDLLYRLVFGNTNIKVENVSTVDMFVTKAYLLEELAKKQNLLTDPLVIENITVNKVAHVKEEIKIGSTGQGSIKFNEATKAIEFIFN